MADDLSISTVSQSESTNRAPRFGQTRPITRLSIGSHDKQANASSLNPVLSADGSILVFASALPTSWMAIPMASATSSASAMIPDLSASHQSLAAKASAISFLSLRYT